MKRYNKIKENIVNDNEYLFKGKWLSIQKTESNYEYVNYVPGVAILPFRNIDNNSKELLIRFESNPVYGDEKAITVVTGRLDSNEDPGICAIRELKEETGYDISRMPFKLNYLGHLRLGKSANWSEQLYIVDLTDVSQGEAKGDGSNAEANSYNEWISEDMFFDLLKKTDDAYLLSIFSKWLAIQK